MKELRSFINLLSSDIIQDPQLQVTVDGERYPAGWQYVLCASAVFLSTTQTLQQ